MEERTEEMQEKVKKETEQVICDILEEGIRMDNIDYLGKVVDIHKDISNEEYWCEKEEVMDMRYSRGYGRSRYEEHDTDSYGRRRRDSRGRYTEGRDRGRGRYRGHDYIDEMYDRYGNYAEANEDHRRGNYGAKDEMLDSIDDTMSAVYDLVCVISEDATPEVMNVIRKHIKKMSEI